VIGKDERTTTTAGQDSGKPYKADEGNRKRLEEVYHTYAYKALQAFSRTSMHGTLSYRTKHISMKVAIETYTSIHEHHVEPLPRNP
jgi:hypothetical protein